MKAIRTLSLVALGLATTSAFAQVSGNYTGKVTLDEAVLRASITEQSKKAPKPPTAAELDGYIKMAKQQITAIKLSLVLDGKGKGKISQPNGTMEEITYKVTGNTIKITTKKTPEGVIGQVKNGGKSIIMLPKDNPKQKQFGATLTFTKA